MPDVAFKDLCIDAVAVAAVAAFWGAALGQRVVTHEDGDAHLVGPDNTPPGRVVWINGVPEAQQAKSRVHLDVRLATDDVGPLVAAGATVVREPDEQVHWTVLRDPDGVELCAFGPRDGEQPGPFELVVDAVDPERIARWWADRTGAAIVRDEGRPWVSLEGVAGSPYRWWVFAPVPEPKTVKNRVHWDVTLLATDVDGLVVAGATVLDRRPDWTVMADPEGNEFCAFASPDRVGSDGPYGGAP